MPSLNEADVLFELFLPLLCENHADALLHLKGSLEFHMTSEPARVWHLSAKPQPWVKRGPAPQPASVIIVVNPAIVEGLAQGRDVDLEAAVKAGTLVVHGDVSVLKAFDLSVAEAQSALATLIKSRKP